jgi:hypothetical protein
MLPRNFSSKNMHKRYFGSKPSLSYGLRLGNHRECITACTMTGEPGYKNRIASAVYNSISLPEERIWFVEHL